MSNGKFTSELLSAGEKIRGGYTQLAESIGKVIALLTGIVAILITFTDVTFAGEVSREISATALTMLISSYVIYFSLESTGERTGEASEEYANAKKRYDEVRAKIKPSDISDLREFCAAYSEEELKYRLDVKLAENGYTREDLEEYKKGTAFPKRKRMTLRRISRERPARLTPITLLSGGGVSQKSEITSPINSKIVTMLRELIPSTVCVVFTASIILSVKGNMQSEEIIEGIVKLAALPIIGARGFTTGYFYARYDLTSWLETKTRLIEGFLLSRDKKDDN